MLPFVVAGSFLRAITRPSGLSATATVAAMPVWFVILIAAWWLRIDSPAGIVVWAVILAVVAIPTGLVVGYVVGPAISRRSHRLGGLRGALISLTFLLGLIAAADYLLFVAMSTNLAPGWMLLAWYLAQFAAPPAYLGCVVYICAVDGHPARP